MTEVKNIYVYVYIHKYIYLNVLVNADSVGKCHKKLNCDYFWAVGLGRNGKRWILSYLMNY